MLDHPFLLRLTLFAAVILSTHCIADCQDDSRRGPLADQNLVAWCIVPFDASGRGPAERAKMLKKLGIRRCAYDWRAQHVPSFEQEILEYKKHGIEFFAFWAGHDQAYALFEKHNIHPQVWRMLGEVEGASQTEKIKSAVESLLPVVERTSALGCKFGLYNHGGWGGEPQNMVAVVKRLRQLGHDHVGIVYNFHHGHGHIADWKESLVILKPHLLCLNLNGMNDRAEPKILGIGKGKHERVMIREIIASGYDGPIGILDHRNELDAEESLRENLVGLRQIREEISSGNQDSHHSTGKTQPFRGVAHVIPGKIEAEHYDLGQPGAAYMDVDPINRGADYRETTQVDIEKRDDASNGHGVGWTKKGEWLVYTVDVKKTGVYDIEIPVASNKQGGVFHIEFSGVDATGPIRIPETGSWQTLKVISKKKVNLTAGRHAMKVVMDSEGDSGSIGDIDYLSFQPSKNPSEDLQRIE